MICSFMGAAENAARLQKLTWRFRAVVWKVARKALDMALDFVAK
jgi:hypothetical protein